jgi:ribosomal protein L7/L12
MVDYVSLIAFFTILGALGFAQQLRVNVERRLARMEEKINSIMNQLGIRKEDQVPPEVAGLVQAGRKIEAIKVYRNATGVSLKEAKDAVELIEANRIIKS